MRPTNGTSSVGGEWATVQALQGDLQRGTVSSQPWPEPHLQRISQCLLQLSAGCPVASSLIWEPDSDTFSLQMVRERTSVETHSFLLFKVFLVLNKSHHVTHAGLGCKTLLSPSRLSVLGHDCSTTPASAPALSQTNQSSTSLLPREAESLQ